MPENVDIADQHPLPSFSTNAILMISDLAFKIIKEGSDMDNSDIPISIVDNLVKK
tara:strand:+ start:115 stop:279 length:165 start_codon:yes stop_codon:yes gene_type:complete